MPRNNAFNQALRQHGLEKQYRAELDALKKDGLTAQKATLKLASKYKALVGGNGGVGPTVAPAGALTRFADAKAIANVGDDADWVYEMLGFAWSTDGKDILQRRMGEAPSAGALGLFNAYKDRPRDFYDEYLPRRMPHRNEIDKADASKRAGKSVPELIKRLLSVFEEEQADT